MFSSGYNDYPATLNNTSVGGTTAMSSYAFINRIWRITKFELVVEM